MFSKMGLNLETRNKKELKVSVVSPLHYHPLSFSCFLLKEVCNIGTLKVLSKRSLLLQIDMAWLLPIAVISPSEVIQNEVMDL